MIYVIVYIYDTSGIINVGRLCKKFKTFPFVHVTHPVGFSVLSQQNGRLEFMLQPD